MGSCSCSTPSSSSCACTCRRSCSRPCSQDRCQDRPLGPVRHACTAAATANCILARTAGPRLVGLRTTAAGAGSHVWRCPRCRQWRCLLPATAATCILPATSSTARWRVALLPAATATTTAAGTDDDDDDASRPSDDDASSTTRRHADDVRAGRCRHDAAAATTRRPRCSRVALLPAISSSSCRCAGSRQTRRYPPTYLPATPRCLLPCLPVSLTCPPLNDAAFAEFDILGSAKKAREQASPGGFVPLSQPTQPSRPPVAAAAPPASQSMFISQPPQQQQAYPSTAGNAVCATHCSSCSGPPRDAVAHATPRACEQSNGFPFF